MKQILKIYIKILYINIKLNNPKSKQMLSNLLSKRIILKQLNLISQYNFGNYDLADDDEVQKPYRTYKQRQQLENKKLFRNNDQSKPYSKNNYQQRESDQTNIDQYVKNINEINKQFLGIKVNTDYFKIYIQKKFDEIIKPDYTKKYKLADLPFLLKGKSSDNKSEPQQKWVQTKASKMVLSMISTQSLNKQLSILVKSYFSDLIKSQRACNFQPNFQSYCRKVCQTLKSTKMRFNLISSPPTIQIQKITLFKGIKVNRNDNYTIDSYKLNYQDEMNGILTYTLFKKEREEYPESQWFAQKFIMARIQAKVNDGPVVQVTDQTNITTTNKGLIHSFVFQADLTVPPSLSALSLSPEEYLKAYRLRPQNIQITNVDNKNPFFNLAFNEQDKKTKLINKII